MSHYDWLDEHLETFLYEVGSSGNKGLISAHGDKCYGYQDDWENAGIPFERGAAIFLLTFVRPYGLEYGLENREHGITAGQWVIDNYERFRPALDKCETSATGQ